MQLSKMYGTGRVKEILISLDVTLTDNFFVMLSSDIAFLIKICSRKIFQVNFDTSLSDFYKLLIFCNLKF